jgi:transposase
MAWSRFRFVRFAADERAGTTLALLAECFEVIGEVPGKVLADRMGCLKGSVVADVAVPAGQYVRFARYGFRPDFCQAADPKSKGIVEHLVGYAKRDLMIPPSLRASIGRQLSRKVDRLSEQPGIRRLRTGLPARRWRLREPAACPVSTASWLWPQAYMPSCNRQSHRPRST